MVNNDNKQVIFEKKKDKKDVIRQVCTVSLRDFLKRKKGSLRNFVFACYVC